MDAVLGLAQDSIAYDKTCRCQLLPQLATLESINMAVAATAAIAMSVKFKRTPGFSLLRCSTSLDLSTLYIYYESLS